MSQNKIVADKIEVVHFHGMQQCWSCITMGEYALETIKNKFPEEYKSGKIVFKDINGELPENKEMVIKYQARGSSLFITAIAYISKGIKTPKNTLLNGLYYTIGRGLSYTVLASLIYLGFSSFEVSRIFQGWGEKILGLVLILIGLVMFDVIKLNIKTKNEKVERLKEKLATKGYLGSFLLGCLFALAFCPYSGVLFFGVLIPLVLRSNEALLLPPLFGLGTGLPVIVFSFLITFSMQKVGQVFSIVQKIEKISRKVVASVFLLHNAPSKTIVFITI